MFLRLLIAALVVLAPSVSLAAKRTEPLSSVAHIVPIVLPGLTAQSTTTYVNAQSINVSDRTALTIAVATIKWPGRNLIGTCTENSGSSLAATITVTGVDQFGQQISETMTCASTTTVTGAKIFRSLTRVELTSATSEQASDTFSLGTGNKVGIPAMFSSDLHEIKAAFIVPAEGGAATAVTDAVVTAIADAATQGGTYSQTDVQTIATLANDLKAKYNASVTLINDLKAKYNASLALSGATQTAVTVNTTNFDTTYFAVKAAPFTSSTVDAGDTVLLFLETDNATPDNRRSPQR